MSPVACRCMRLTRDCVYVSVVGVRWVRAGVCLSLLCVRALGVPL